MTRDEAQKRIAAINEPYKMEILESIKTEPITIYHIGKLVLLCLTLISKQVNIFVNLSNLLVIVN